MKELFNDFMLIERLPDGQERVRIPSKIAVEANVHEGDEVLLIEYDNLRATARIQCEDGHWYGLIIGQIEDMSTDTVSAETSAVEEMAPASSAS